MNIAKTIFKAFSYAFHPTLMPLIGVYLLLSYTHLVLIPYEGKIAIFRIVGMSTLVFPLIVLPFLFYQKLITNITVSERNERLLPFALAIMFYFFGYYILKRLGAPELIQHFILSSFICVLLAGIINFKWKISLHMIGVGGLIGLISSMSYLYQVGTEFMLMASILMAGISGSARLYLQEHNQTQIYAGFLIGFIVTFCIVVGMASNY
jgi:hypothetical protein